MTAKAGTKVGTQQSGEGRAAIILIAGTLVFGAGFFFLLFATDNRNPAAGFMPQSPASRLIVPDHPRRLVDFFLTDRTGRTQRDLSGRILVVNFLFTSCSLTCPAVNRQMARIQQMTTNQPDVMLISLTVDPRDDTPTVLQKYGERFGAQTNRWLFLTGERRVLYHLIGSSFLSQDLDDPFSYSSKADQSELKPGDPLPDYAFTSEEGKPIRISDFRGRAVALTFFFTRCPLPDYCPRMNHNFEQTRHLLQADAGARKNWQFLSISFDPGFDTPEILSNYAEGYRGQDKDRWLFVSAPTNVLADVAVRLNLMVTRQGGSISHNLRTVVLDASGRIYKQLDGNEWTPQQLAVALANAARTPGR